MDAYDNLLEFEKKTYSEMMQNQTDERDLYSTNKVNYKNSKGNQKLGSQTKWEGKHQVSLDADARFHLFPLAFHFLCGRRSKTN